jgi:hypothetical protein
MLIVLTLNIAACGAGAGTDQTVADIVTSADAMYASTLKRVATLETVTLPRTLVADELSAWYEAGSPVLARATFFGPNSETYDFVFERGGELVMAVRRSGVGTGMYRAYFHDGNLVSSTGTEDAESLKSMAQEVLDTLKRHRAGEDVQPRQLE